MFTYLLHNLGAKDVQFEELVSLEPESLRELRYVSHPAQQQFTIESYRLSPSSHPPLPPSPPLPIPNSDPEDVGLS